MNIQNAVEKGFNILKNHNIKSSVLDSEILLSKAIQKDRKFIILNPKVELDTQSNLYFDFLINQRSKGKPIAYILGKKEFWKYEFIINEDVLIPRPDTELIVEQVLKMTKNKPKLSILDIGVGSGCILLSILKERKNYKGIGIDISKKCIDICKINTFKLALHNRVKLFKTDIDNFAYGKYDLVISNPPYISKFDFRSLDNEVVGFEPKLALYGGIDGISEISKIVNKASKLVKNNGKFILEIAHDQKKIVKRLLTNNGFYINKVLKDLAKNDRCIISTKI